MPKPKTKKVKKMPANKAPLKGTSHSNAKKSASKKTATKKTARWGSGLLPKFTFSKLTAGIVIAVFAVVGSVLVLFGRADTSAKLAWTPPALSSPTTIEINSDIIKSRGANGHKFYLDNTKDYYIKIGKVDTTLGGVVLAGGRNVVVMGGYITVPYAGTSPDIASRRGLLLYRQVGTVHVEGLLIDNAGGDLSEGINIDAPNAIVQIQNVRVTGIHARDQVNFSDNHPDLIQPYGGVKELRVDRFTGTTDSQGIFLTGNHAPIRKVDLRRVNFAVTNANYSYGFHRIDGNTTGTGEVSKFPVNTSDVWVQPAPGKTFQRTVINQTCTTSGCKDYPITISSDGNIASWPTDSTFTGVVRKGIPGSGDFVPASSVGLNYVSPGYLSDPNTNTAPAPAPAPTPAPAADTIAPAVTIAAPTNALGIGRKVSIKATASDNVGVAKMEVYIDGKLQATSTTDSISYNWNARRASKGAHTITVKAYDAAGKAGQSSVTVYK